MCYTCEEGYDYAEGYSACAEDSGGVGRTGIGVRGVLFCGGGEGTFGLGGNLGGWMDGRYMEVFCVGL